MTADVIQQRSVGMYLIKNKGLSAFDIVSCVLFFFAVVRILVAARAQSHQICETELELHCNFSSPESVTFRRRRTPNTAGFIIALVVFFLGCYVTVNFSVLCETFGSYGLCAFEKRHVVYISHVEFLLKHGKTLPQANHHGAARSTGGAKLA